MSSVWAVFYRIQVLLLSPYTVSTWWTTKIWIFRLNAFEELWVIKVTTVIIFWHFQLKRVELKVWLFRLFKRISILCVPLFFWRIFSNIFLFWWNGDNLHYFFLFLFSDILYLLYESFMFLSSILLNIWVWEPSRA